MALDPAWLAAGAAVITALGATGTGLYLWRSNRTLLNAQASKTTAEGEGSTVETAVVLLKEFRAERQDLREQLEKARLQETITREERDKLLADLRLQIAARDREIKLLRKVLRDAGVEEPAEFEEASTASGATLLR